MSERIHRLTDTGGDGLADRIDLFADGFQTEVTGIAAGVLWHEGEVYATIAPDVWRLRDTDGDGTADLREIIATGFGLHIAYAGHDMHGLTVGPDGRIYWSIGDKGISATSQEGVRYHYPNQGGVMRCDPDGSNFEVFAHGLRNVQELAFDEYGNLFGVDNDADQPGEKERFVYIVQDMDAAWRCNYQYRGSGYNPWTAEKLWEPSQPGQPAYFLPPISLYEDGPAGFVYNPGTALSPEWRRWFFMTEAPRGNQWAFQVLPDGASFEMVNSRQIGTGIALVGLNWGPDGGLYGVDWGGGYPLNQTGAVWKIDVPGAEQSPERLQVRELMRKDYAAAEPGDLATLLGHPDQRIRLKAQLELANRRERDQLQQLAQSGPELARVHAIWGLGQLNRAGDRDALRALVALLADPQPEIRAQVLKTLGDAEPGSISGDTQAQMVALVDDQEPRVRFFAAMTAGALEIAEAEPAIVQLLEANDGADLYLRHAGITGLARLKAGEALSEHPSPEVRLCAVVALRRNADPAVAKFLSDAAEEVATEAALAIHDDFSIPEALPDLARLLEKTQFTNEALIRRAINANLRLGSPSHALALARYAGSPIAPLGLRLDALAALQAWPDPPNLDRVDGRFRKQDPRDPRPVAEVIGPELGRLLASPEDSLVESTLAAADALEVALDSASLELLLKNASVSGSLRAQALQNLNTAEAIDFALKADEAVLRIRGAELLAKTSKDRIVPYLTDRLESGPLREQQSALRLLAEQASADADAVLADWAARITELPPGLHLDIIEAATARSLDSHLSAYLEATRQPGVLTTNFLECLEGGVSARGKEVFETHVAAQCARCHKVKDGKGSIIGPNLKNAGAKDRRYILESLIEPMKDISKGYGTVTLTLQDGSVVAGQFRKESDTVIELRNAEGKTMKVKKAQVKERSPALSVMPPMGFILTKQELRDLLAYLASLKTE